MNERKIQVTIGGLLHDIGKIILRTNTEKGDHSWLGEKFIRENLPNLDIPAITEQILFHHSSRLKNAKLDESALAYVTYIADNISAASDRRGSDEIEGENEGGFNPKQELESIFNLLNKEKANPKEKKRSYPGKTFEGEAINYPHELGEIANVSYENILRNMKDDLADVTPSQEKINSILELLEAYTTFLPSSTNKEEIPDISIYDHSKTTAAFGACILDYLNSEGITDFKTTLFKEAKTFYDKKAFLLISMDISGIQNFIYTITSKGALKGLRARSFYLEIMLEHIVDELLEKLEFARTNLIYSGGGHAYVLAANTGQTKKIVEEYFQAVNKWYLEYFNTALYIAWATVECSANELGMGEQPEDYKNLFRELSAEISRKKLNRYSAEDILCLNGKGSQDHGRECVVCHRSDLLTPDNKCAICSSLESMSPEILKEDSCFLVLKTTEPGIVPERGVILPVSHCVIVRSEKEAEKYKDNPDVIRVYGKNKWLKGAKYATKLWIGDYAPNPACTFEDLADESTGIRRICVLRADVDNLGQAFVAGFEDKHLTLSRTATLSRNLSIFFKKHINYLLKNGSLYLSGVGETADKAAKARNIVIVYSGGDDVFLVGAWDEVIGAAVDLREALQKFSLNRLTISAGIGIYPDKFPIAAMARESGELEDAAKQYKDSSGKTLKNAVTLFDEKFTFSWDDFTENVLGEKLKLIQTFFDDPKNARGKNFIYNLLEYIRNADEKINIARYAYLLARMEPDQARFKGQDEAYKKQKAKYDEFKKKMYAWMKAAEDRKRVILALYLYVYMTREKESEE
ncbi:MAG: type III-A CRISPR-associated protein Cas10/Csm1 [Fusobacteriaceae bacterium]|nr:type III-A CRISPR-associated protein Cas10/Csm1 [Fusobacteriaceae bacterium]